MLMLGAFPFLPASYNTCCIASYVLCIDPKQPASLALLAQTNRTKQNLHPHCTIRGRGVRFLLVVTIVLADNFGSYFSDVVNK